MLKNNDENKLIDKLIQATFVALLCSLLSTLYISKIHATEVMPAETLVSDLQFTKVSNVEAAVKKNN